MRKHLKNPTDLSIRLTSSALSRMNNCLPFFPGGDEDSKFSQDELLEILECSLPFAWKQKFDYDGYVPTDHTKAELISSCDTIERKGKLRKETRNRKRVRTQTRQSKRNPSSLRTKVPKGTITAPIMA